MSKKSTVGFSFRVEGATLQTMDNNLRITSGFVTQYLMDEINQKLKEKKFKVDESSIRPRYIDDQLYIEGFAREIEEPKTVGFLSGM
jgi:hypothetical protein